MINRLIYFSLFLMFLFGINGFAQNNQKQTKVLISTVHGDLSLVLYNETPKHKANFIKLVNEGYYNGLLFHRVIQQFMIQGGDPNSRDATPTQMLGNGGPKYTIEAEFNPKLIHKKGALAAARQPDNVNPKKRSSGSQFYIVQGKKFSKIELERLGRSKGITYSEAQLKSYETEGGYAPLDMEYTVFGELIAGFDVLDKIAAQKVGKYNRPIEDLKMTVKIVN